jgi:NAD(P)-dependent dehydrogenase (short-subunit alcohol dehydrogenase family)
MHLENRVVIITSGKRIGRVVAQQLADRGADMVLSYRGSKTEAEQTVSDMHARGRRAIAVAADVSVAADCAASSQPLVASSDAWTRW